MDFTTIRLDPDDPQGWLWWPAFEIRVKNFVEKYLPETDPKAVASDMRQRFLTQPKLSGFWLAMDKDGRPVAHMVSWIAVVYGKAHIFVYQAEADEKYKITEVVKLVLAGMGEWASKLNESIPEEANRIQRVEMATWRDAEVWERYLKMLGFASVKVRSVIQFDLNIGPKNP